jgi:CO/xanthine dehydrogenase Mo-binding subunit
MEPRSGLAAYDRTTGHFDVYMPTQGMGDIMKEFAHVTGLPPTQFRIHAKDVGGGFGVRNEIYPEFSALAFAARELDRPVKWVGTVMPAPPAPITSTSASSRCDGPCMTLSRVGVEPRVYRPHG